MREVGLLARLDVPKITQGVKFFLYYMTKKSVQSINELKLTRNSLLSFLWMPNFITECFRMCCNQIFSFSIDLFLSHYDYMTFPIRLFLSHYDYMRFPTRLFFSHYNYMRFPIRLFLSHYNCMRFPIRFVLEPLRLYEISHSFADHLRLTYMNWCRLVKWTNSLWWIFTESYNSIFIHRGVNYFIELSDGTVWFLIRSGSELISLM